MSIPFADLSEYSYIKPDIMSDMNDFPDWLVSELKSRGWSQAELARRAGVSRTAISDAISGKNPAGFEVCSAIARALKLPPEAVFRAAGLLPAKPAIDPTDEELLYLFDQLTDEEQEELLAYARMRLERQNSKNAPAKSISKNRTASQPD